MYLIQKVFFVFMILLGGLKRCSECVPFKPEFSVIYSRYETLYYLMHKCFQISNMLCVSACKLSVLALAVSEQESQIFEKATPFFGGRTEAVHQSSSENACV